MGKPETLPCFTWNLNQEHLNPKTFLVSLGDWLDGSTKEPLSQTQNPELVIASLGEQKKE